ncbi:MAG: hypothetical protein ACI9YT_001992 [Halobacteriales archaeon]|jgi:hypothetical protein
MSDDHTNNILSPDQLELDDEHIRPLNENRYVVSVDEKSSPSSVADDRDELISGCASVNMTKTLADLEGAYAFEVHARFEGKSDSLCIETNDVSEAFDSVLRWYAGKVADDTPPEDVIAVLLANSDLNIDIQHS